MAIRDLEVTHRLFCLLLRKEDVRLPGSSHRPAIVSLPISSLDKEPWPRHICMCSRAHALLPGSLGTRPRSQPALTVTNIERQTPDYH